VAVVQARFGSERLPGKVLRPMRGQPMLGYLLEALTHCRSIDVVVVATSADASDDAVALFAQASGVRCHRGSLDDVASRVLGAAEAVRADAVIRLSGDSPLLDPAVVDRGVELFRSEPSDLVSNVVTRSFPRGQSVEVLSRDALARAVAVMTSAHEREHVTPHFYSNAADYVIRSFCAAHPRPDVQLSVDDEDDFVRCEAILESLGRPPWEAGWEACVRAADALDVKARQ
jgi:spore coat polysaccharide biosynthesis protein SpsF